MVYILDDLLEVLKDGDWHTFEEVAAQVTKLNENQLEAILGFLEDYGFINRRRKTWSLHTRKVQLKTVITSFLFHIQELETKVE